MKYTYDGDANLDGKINIDDYGVIDFNVASSGSVFGWWNGDFNLDGKINIDDYGVIDFNVNAQGAFLASGPIIATAGIAQPAEYTTAVPEPAWIAVSSLAMLLHRRSRREIRETTPTP